MHSIRNKIASTSRRWWSSGRAEAESAGAGRMWAWRAHGYGAGPEGVRLERARVPALTAPDQLLVRVRAASINPIDVAMLDGYGSQLLNTWRRYTWDAGHNEGPEFPLIVGRDFTGYVERAGADVPPELSVGAKVWGVLPPHAPGSLSEFVRADYKWVGLAPERMSMVESAGLVYAGLTAAAALSAAGGVGGVGGVGAVGGNARVLLLGLGGVGGVLLQLLRHAGAQVVVGCPEEQGEMATSWGAAAVLPREHTDYLQQINKNGPYWAVFDCAGLGGGFAARVAAERYVTLSSPLLREGPWRAAALWAAHSARAGRPVRWAFFRPSGCALALLRRLADAGRLRGGAARVFAWREADAALASAANRRLRGKLLLDFAL